MSVALVCIAKNEDHYIDEWLQYNIKLQFSDIYVYQNDWRYSGNKMQYNNVHWCIMDGQKKQFDAYNDFIAQYGHLYNWACFFDCDEFLVMKGYDNVHKYFSQYNHLYGIAINWKIFGDSNQHLNKDYSVLSRFKRCQIGLDKHVKPCLNLSKLKSISSKQLYFDNPHYIKYAYTNKIMKSSNGKCDVVGAFNDDYNDNVYLCHFFGKTIEEFEQKQIRGRAASQNSMLTLQLFQQHNYNDSYDDYAYQFMQSHKICNSFKSVSYENIAMNSFSISIDIKKYELQKKIFSKNNLIIPQLSIGCTNEKLKPYQRCTQSHVSIINYAKTHNLPYVLVFEDDAYPCINCRLVFEEYLNHIPNDATMIILGWPNHKHNTQTFNKYFNRVTTCTICGSHAYILFKNAYDKYLDYFTTHSTGKADNDIYQILNAYILDKPLFIQYSEQYSMNNHIGYIYYGNHKNPPTNFMTIDEMLK